jgi:hypothetical protein
MEDYIPILVIVAAMVIQLFSSNKKKQAQRHAENFPELPGLPDIFPDLVTTPEPVPEPLAAAPVVEGGRATDAERILEHMRKESASDKVPKEEQKRAEIPEDFDIRKAIIYHEILQPKYLE